MLGSSLVKSFSKYSNLEISAFTRQNGDLTQPSEFYEFAKRISPNLVIHTASRVGGIGANLDRPLAFIQENLAIDHGVISACLDLGIENLLTIGSSCMYPKNLGRPILETDLLTGPLEQSNEGYALAKIAAAKMCEYASQTRGVSFKTIVPSNLFGPNDNFDPLRSHLLASVIRKVHEAKENGHSEIEVWGSGKARREFTYTKDLADWIAQITISGIRKLPPILNVGVGLDHSVEEFYRIAMEVIGLKASLVFDESKPEGMLSKLMDSSLARAQYSWNPTTPLETAIEETYAWYLSSLKGDEGK